jgi:hypothetical protein
MINSELTRSEARKKGLKILGKFYLIGFCMYLVLLLVVYLISPDDIIFVHFLGFGFLFITVVPILGTLVLANIFSLLANAFGWGKGSKSEGFSSYGGSGSGCGSSCGGCGGGD